MKLRNIEYYPTYVPPSELDPEEFEILLKRVDYEDDFRWTFYRVFSKKDHSVRYAYVKERLNFETFKYEVYHEEGYEE